MKRHFASAYKKVGTFTIVHPPNGQGTKVGGNVAAYFCTPDLRVLSAVGGPVSPADFLSEAKKAVELAAATADGLSEDAGARAEALQAGRGNPWSREGLHEYLLRRILEERPLAPLELVYGPVFVALGETLSDAPVAVEDAILNARFR